MRLWGRRGFTLIELLVVIVIIGVMAALVMPSFSSMIQNGRIGSTTRSVSLGLQTARAEAIRRNQNVEFILTNSAVGTPAAAVAAAPAAAGRNWVVRYQAAVGGPYSFVEAKGTGPNDYSGVGVTGTAAAGSLPPFTGTVVFNSLGSVVGGQATSVNIDNQPAGACAKDGGAMRCQLVQVRPGGQIHPCDPMAALGDSRYCPAPL